MNLLYPFTDCMIRQEEKENFVANVIYLHLLKIGFPEEIEIPKASFVKAGFARVKVINSLGDETIIRYHESNCAEDGLFGTVICSSVPSREEKRVALPIGNYHFIFEKGNSFLEALRAKEDLFYEVVWNALGQKIRRDRRTPPAPKTPIEYDELPEHVEGFIRPTKSEREARINELETSLRKRGIIT